MIPESVENKEPGIAAENGLEAGPHKTGSTCTGINDMLKASGCEQLHQSGKVLHQTSTVFRSKWSLFQHTPWMIITSFTYHPALDLATSASSLPPNNTRHRGTGKFPTKF